MVDLSIILPVYNHAPYIKQAIDSILMQKVNFTYEVLIGEDCSTDNSREILKNLEKNLPSNFHIFYREKNMGGKGEGNFNDLYKRMQGRYISVLEGDDFWTYEYKLQKEYDFLEAHPDYIAVAHDTEVVDENGNKMHWTYPCCRKPEYTIWDFRKGLLAGQTATIMARNYINDPSIDTQLLPSSFPGDRKKAFLLIANGRVHCFLEKWSAYRLVVTHGSSFSATSRLQPPDFKAPLDYYYSLYDYACKHDVDEKVKLVTEQLYFNYLFRIVLRKKISEISFKDLKEAFHNLHHPIRTSVYTTIQSLLWPYHKINGRLESIKYEKATGLR
ncbi:glycosyltransferase family 2 protein [Mitsuokella multacida]|uniref:glycosyltransferase family 2 protein n=1 Tax=Mitsuokella multacida TaxID=52226 RepID=UPI0022E50064|nr:glycosyltransferase family 2 protein [Mitsuokella multacida]